MSIPNINNNNNNTNQLPANPPTATNYQQIYSIYAATVTETTSTATPAPTALPSQSKLSYAERLKIQTFISKYYRNKNKYPTLSEIAKNFKSNDIIVEISESCTSIQNYEAQTAHKFWLVRYCSLREGTPFGIASRVETQLKNPHHYNLDFEAFYRLLNPSATAVKTTSPDVKIAQTTTVTVAIPQPTILELDLKTRQVIEEVIQQKIHTKNVNYKNVLVTLKTRGIVLSEKTLRDEITIGGNKTLAAYNAEKSHKNLLYFYSLARLANSSFKPLATKEVFEELFKDQSCLQLPFKVFYELVKTTLQKKSILSSTSTPSTSKRGMETPTSESPNKRVQREPVNQTSPQPDLAFALGSVVSQEITTIATQGATNEPTIEEISLLSQALNLFNDPA